MSGLEAERGRDRLVAVFETLLRAESARDTLLQAGIPPAAIHVIAPISGHGADHMADALPVFEGHVVVAVQPATEAERDAIIEVLESCLPIEIDAPPGTREVVPEHPSLNHTLLSRADMIGKTLHGAPYPARDMSGHPMELQSLSEATMRAASAPRHDLPLAPPPAATEPEPPVAPARPADIIAGTTYTHGVPQDVARRMTAEEQVQAQAPAGRFRRVAWPDRNGRPTRVSSFYENDSPTDRLGA